MYPEVLFSLNAPHTPHRPSKTLFWIKLGSKNKKTPIYKISRMLFSNMDFNFAHFANFNFVHFEIEESFGLTWVKLQNG